MSIYSTFGLIFFMCFCSYIAGASGNTLLLLLIPLAFFGYTATLVLNMSEEERMEKLNDDVRSE